MSDIPKRVYMPRLWDGYDGTMAVCERAEKDDLVYNLETQNQDTRLDTAMKLLRDNKMHFDREMNQADHDVLREARKWR